MLDSFKKVVDRYNPFNITNAISNSLIVRYILLGLLFFIGNYRFSLSKRYFILLNNYSLDTKLIRRISAL